MNGLEYVARGGSSGGRGGGARSSSRSSSSRSSSKSTSKSSTTSKPRTSSSKGTSKAKPGSTVKTLDGKEVKSSAKTPTNKTYRESSGIVGDNGYAPRFNNGYTAPAGSVVYYPQHSALDYLPWIYLFNAGGHSPTRDQTVIVQPDGKEVQAQPAQEGIDGMAVFNWIILVVMALVVIGGIVWGVNKLTNKGD